MALFKPKRPTVAEIKLRIGQTKDIHRPGPRWQEYEDGSREFVPPAARGDKTPPPSLPANYARPPASRPAGRKEPTIMDLLRMHFLNERKR